MIKGWAFNKDTFTAEPTDDLNEKISTMAKELQRKIEWQEHKLVIQHLSVDALINMISLCDAELVRRGKAR